MDAHAQKLSYADTHIMEIKAESAVSDNLVKKNPILSGITLLIILTIIVSPSHLLSEFQMSEHIVRFCEQIG